jgi:GcrA cell cycle regulator
MAKWIDEHDNCLRELIAAGESYTKAASIINARFGTDYTRNATIGRSHRLGIDPFRRPGTPPRPPRPKKERVRALRIITGGKRAPPRMIESREILELRCAEITPLNKSFLELGQNDCRYGYGDGPFTFCGHSVQDDSSWCPLHHALVHDRRESTKPPAFFWRVA